MAGVNKDVQMKKLVILALVSVTLTLGYFELASSNDIAPTQTNAIIEEVISESVTEELLTEHEEVVDSVATRETVIEVQAETVEVSKQATPTPERWEPYKGYMNYSETTMICIDNYVNTHFRGGELNAESISERPGGMYHSVVLSMFRGAAHESMTVCEYVDYYVATRH